MKILNETTPSEIKQKQMDYQEVSIQKIKEIFRRFAEIECKEVSPLYFDLSNKISNDVEILKIASFCQWRQPIPNLFFASVHYLLLSNQEEELANYYPSLRKDSKEQMPFELFKEFCLKNQELIKELEQTKIVQTNALNRCAYLMPILSNEFESQEINLIDIGTSAGLTLNLDKYEYHYDDKYHIGDSAVKVRSEIRGGDVPDSQSIVKINKKTGIDQNPLDLKIKENANWLKALIWADLTERIERIDAAINIAQQEKIQFEKASTIDKFKEIIQTQEVGIPLVIYHTNALYQFTKEERKEFRTLIDSIGNNRDLVYLAAEGSSVFDKDYGLDEVLVQKTEYRNGKKTCRIVAQTNGHANWIKWK